MKSSNEFAPRPLYDVNDLFAIDASSEARAQFLRLTYAHLMIAILAFVGLTYFFLSVPAIREPLFNMMLGAQWFLVLIGFMVVGWVADRWARSGTSQLVQYAGLGLYTVAEAIIFVPLLYAVSQLANDESVIPTAGALTLLATAIMTAFVFISGKDFSFLRPMIIVLSFVLLGSFAAFAFFGVGLPATLFAGIGVLLGSGAVLYSTSQVMHHYRTDQYVAAALSLFAAIALLFWYVIQLVSISDD